MTETYESIKKRHTTRTSGPNGEDARRFTLIRFKDIVLSTVTPYLVEHLIPREGLVVVWGPPKSGKTFWMFDVGMHVALGWEYRDRRVEAGAVVYVASEGERGLSARKEAFRLKRLADSASDKDPPFYLLTTRLNLVADVEALIEAVRTQLDNERCVLIIIDTLNRTIAGSESKDEDMTAYVNAADRLREAFGATIAIIHHCGVNGERPRGHTSLTGAADAQLATKREQNSRVIVEVEFMKDGPEGDEIHSRLSPVDVGLDDTGKMITSCIIEPIEENPGATGGRRAQAPRLSAANNRALTLLVAAIARGGEVPPPDSHIPQNTPCVVEDVWREAIYQGSVSNSDKPDAKRKAFNRVARALVAGGQVGKSGKWVWPTR